MIESVRCGLVFQLKDAVGAKTIEAIEQRWLTKAYDRLSGLRSLVLLGPDPLGMSHACWRL